MALPTASISGEGAIATPAEASTPAYKNPFLWVPSSYLTMGLIYITVGAVANIMFKNMGMPNDQAAFWSSILGFPYTFKFLWAPALELYKTKKNYASMFEKRVKELEKAGWSLPVYRELIVGDAAKVNF